MTQSQNCNRLAIFLDPEIRVDMFMATQDSTFIAIRYCTFGHVSREPVSQWKIRERKLLPESIHSPFHSLHGSRVQLATAFMSWIFLAWRINR